MPGTEVRSMLSILTYREAVVVTLTYRDNLTQEEISLRIETCRATVNRCLQTAERKLRDSGGFIVEWIGAGQN